jgi:Sulfotransferase family
MENDWEKESSVFDWDQFSDSTHEQKEDLVSEARSTFISSPTNHCLITKQLHTLSFYEVDEIDRVVAICSWGRSGTHLLASFLDNHDRVLMMAATRSRHIYTFFDQFKDLSLWDKLLTYPFFTKKFFGLPFFNIDWFEVSLPDYFAAVKAIYTVYRNRPREYLQSSRAFFQFVHVAYGVAAGWRPATRRPLMVYVQDDWDDIKAQKLIDDFPQAKFLHTMRDPISAFDRLFEYQIGLSDTDDGTKDQFSITVPLIVARWLIRTDRPHPRMEDRSRFVRFEDLHCKTEETIRRVAAWLDLEFCSSLLQSTFDFGKPYFVSRKGKTWSGANPDQARRHSRNISRLDRAFFYALFYNDFVAWDYPYPPILRSAAVRVLILMLLILFPTKMECTVARASLKLQVLPALREGNALFAISRLARILYCRMALIGLFGVESFRRLLRRPRSVSVLMVKTS